MCILLKLDYAKFGVSNFFEKLLKKNLWGSARSPLDTGKVKRIPAETLSQLSCVGMSIRDSKIYPKSIVKFLSEDPKVSEGAINSFQNETKVRKSVWCIWIYSDLFGIVTIVFLC